MQRDYRHIFHEPDAQQQAHLFCALSAGIYECDKSFYEDSFYHEGYYFLCVLSGRGFVGIDDRLYPVSAGHLAFLELSRPYKFYPDPADPWKFAWLRFDSTDAAWFYSLICDRSNLFYTSDVSSFAAKMEALLVCHETQETGFVLQASALIQQILADLYAVSRDFRSAYVVTKEYPSAVKLVTEYININYFRKLTLAELASVAFLSPYHLLREFKKHTGFTPLEYTNLYRLSLAKQMLGASDLTIEQIALNTGFCSHSYFSKRFREDTGMTPEQFRGRNR